MVPAERPPGDPRCSDPPQDLGTPPSSAAFSRRRPGTCPGARNDQVIPSLASRDAIGAHTLALSHALRSAGIDSDIFYGNCTPDVADRGRPVVELGRATRDRWLLYQSSIGSGVYDILAARSEPKLVNYHNITPAELLAPWEPNVGFEVALGRSQLQRLAPHSGLAVADSAYNEGELAEVGYRTTAVVPLLIDMTATGADPDPALAGRLAAAKERGGADLLFVGKVSPHKAPHDLVKMLAVYRRCFDPRARLHLVGSPLGERYGPSLAAFVEDLGMSDAVTVTGSVSPAELEAYYRAADVFVCASDHEGFCSPHRGHGARRAGRRLRGGGRARDGGRRRPRAHRQGAAALRRRRQPGGRRRTPAGPDGRGRRPPGGRLLGRAVDRAVRRPPPPGRGGLTARAAQRAAAPVGATPAGHGPPRHAASKRSASLGPASSKCRAASRSCPAATSRRSQAGGRLTAVHRRRPG